MTPIVLFPAIQKKGKRKNFQSPPTVKETQNDHHFRLKEQKGHHQDRLLPPSEEHLN